MNKNLSFSWIVAAVTLAGFGLGFSDCRAGLEQSAWVVRDYCPEQTQPYFGETISNRDACFRGVEYGKELILGLKDAYTQKDAKLRGVVTSRSVSRGRNKQEQIVVYRDSFFEYVRAQVGPKCRELSNNVEYPNGQIVGYCENAAVQLASVVIRKFPEGRSGPVPQSDVLYIVESHTVR
jgi:hypothetical protein